MRWLFLLLLVLNGVYYVWHQQEAPLRAKEVAPLSLYRSAHQDIQLLSESDGAGGRRAASAAPEREGDCVYLGAVARQDLAQSIVQRLQGSNIKAQAGQVNVPDSAGYWVRIAPESQHLLDDALLQNLAKEFNELKHKIMPCEGIATVE
ncbi:MULTISPECIES: SPOR domain-containing protein [unclassified Pseudomonas]|jgi:hypothetical protein|uniref:SPOR domain-containing protein n=1 Tax=unclassified Pseudomonas TaxID=196821 RepID=UPI000C2FC1A3|nr:MULTISPECIES: hypothetical protein [unclassified Pseudomonas]MCU1736902.1 hypothetical protein [Pseudomonas sp. 20S_6.2_Bac1]